MVAGFGGEAGPATTDAMEWTQANVAVVLVGAAVLGLVLVLVGVFLTRGLVRAGQSPAPSMLVVSLSLLSLTALLGGLIWNSDSALALAGAGIGALAGAVSSTFTAQSPCPPQEHEHGDHDA